MATQSQVPPSDENPPKPGLTQAATENHTQAATENQQDVQADAPKQSSPTSVFVNSEPMREEQVQNAVKFLSHPRVRGSPVVYRRSFLEKKGLTKEEIDEAFRRVPDPPPTVQTGGGNQADGLKTSQGMQTQSQVQAPQPAAAAPTNAISPVAPRYRFHWSHAVLAVGLVAASGAGTAVIIKNAIIPRLKSWIRKVASEEENDSVKKTDSQPSLAEEAAAAAKAAAAAAADVAKASQEMMNSKNEEKRYFGELMNMLNVQVQEMKSMSNSIQKLEGETNALRRNSLIDQDNHQFNVINSKRPYANGKADYDSRSVRSASPPAAAEPSVAPHPKSYMEIMAMVQRGEKPPNIREINDSPPNPNQQPSNPRLAPKAKPWEVGQAQNYSSQVTQSQASNEGAYSNVQDNGINYSSNGDSSVPWWQRRNPRITEIENEDERKKGVKKKIVDPFSRKEWYDIKAPCMFNVTNVGKTLVNRTQGTKIASEGLKGRVFECSLADLQNDEVSSKKYRLIAEEIQGRTVLTNFHGMDLTTDKLRSVVKKWQTLIEANVLVRTTDGYVLRVFCIGFTKKMPNQVKKTSYAQSKQVRMIRKRMVDIISREVSTVDLKEVVNKLIPDSIGKDIEKSCQSIYPLHDVMIRKVKVLKKPRFDLTKLLDLHGDSKPVEGGKSVKVDRPDKFEKYEPPVQQAV